MATHTADFWPDIGQPESRTPVALLREQARILGEKTQFVVTAEVHSDTEGEDFVYDLYLVASALHYRYQLLTVRHPLFVYPMSVATPGKIPTTVESENEFADWLKEVLVSD